MSVSVERDRYAELAQRLAGRDVELGAGVLLVGIGVQRLWRLTGAGIAASYEVSTSRHGSGCAQDSYRTPLGLHRIEQKIGGGAPEGTRFRGRRPVTAAADAVGDDADPVTSRILWLRGLEPGRNSGAGCDSYSRYIYIHGTPHAAAIGTPASIGCIRMRDTDVIALFDQVREGTPVVIEP